MIRKRNMKILKYRNRPITALSARVVNLASYLAANKGNKDMDRIKPQICTEN